MTPADAYLFVLQIGTHPTKIGVKMATRLGSIAAFAAASC